METRLGSFALLAAPGKGPHLLRLEPLPALGFTLSGHWAPGQGRLRGKR